jgi:hypothetical protein
MVRARLAVVVGARVCVRAHRILRQGLFVYHPGLLGPRCVDALLALRDVVARADGRQQVDDERKDVESED